MSNEISNEAVGIDNVDWSDIDSKEDFDQALNEAFGLDESSMLDAVITQGIATVGVRQMMMQIDEMKKSMNTDA